jgi:hypothetical protein
MEERRNQQQPGRRQASRPSQQQGGGQDSPRQQQQFDSGGGADNRFADQIRPHMDVVDQSGVHVGTVDHVDGDRIKLTRGSSGSGEHQYLPLSQVAGIESNRVRLQARGDTSFGMEAEH